MTQKTNEISKRTAAHRIIDVLELLARDPSTSAIEISKKLDIPQPTVYRMMQTLVDEHLFLSDPAGSLQPGPRLKNLLMDIIRHEPISSKRLVILEKLSKEIGETCSLSIPRGPHLVYFSRYEANWPIQLTLNIGDKIDLWCTASGKLYLSTMSDDERSTILNNLILEKRAKNTITNIDKLIRSLAQIKELGFSLDSEEWFDGMVGAAVPLDHPNGHFCASLSMHALSARMSYSNLIACIPAMKRSARDLEQIIFSNWSSEGQPVIVKSGSE